MLVRQEFEEFSKNGDDLDLSEFTRILAFCSDQGIETTVLISPLHASILNTVALAGKWQSYLSWQRSVVEAAQPYRDNVTIIGIEDNPNIVLQPIEASSSFFRDGVHYNDDAGAQIMDCLVKNDCSESIKPVHLDTNNLGVYLEGISRLMLEYRITNAQDYAQLLRWVGMPANHKMAAP